MHPYLNIAIGAARKAGREISRSIDNLDKVRVTEKSVNDFVTTIDKYAEEIIIEEIMTAYPDHGIISEERETHNPDAETVWIIDPLDGTLNFIHGLPHISISIAVQHQGVLQHGLVYDPLRQELFLASKGSGATLNGKRIRVNDKSSIAESLIGTGFPSRDKSKVDSYVQQFSRILHQCVDIRRAGSAALDLAYVACGRLDAYWEDGLLPWDMAAGCLIVRESGGYVSDFKGASDNIVNQGQVLASAPKLHSKLLNEM